MEQKERELLTTFFKNNEDLIRAAINALGIPELSQSMAKVAHKGGHPRRAYAINGKGSYSMYDVVEKFVEYRLANSSDSVQDIDKEITGYIGGGRVNVSDTQKSESFKKTRSLMVHSLSRVVKSDIPSSGVTATANLLSANSVRV